MKVLKFLLDLVYPPVCALCGASCKIAICSGCEKRLELVGEKRCFRCGAGLKSRSCVECRRRTYRFERAVAVGHYVGTLRNLVLRFKLGGEVHLAREFGRRLANQVLEEALPIDRVVAVPMGRMGMLRRGYHPAEELARAVASSLERPFVRALQKIRETPPQATLAREERVMNPMGAFRVNRPKPIRGRSILLVDDVFTTGATANECAQMLLEARAKEVYLAVIGR